MPFNFPTLQFLPCYWLWFETRVKNCWSGFSSSQQKLIRLISHPYIDRPAWVFGLFALKFAKISLLIESVLGKLGYLNPFFWRVLLCFNKENLFNFQISSLHVFSFYLACGWAGVFSALDVLCTLFNKRYSGTTICKINLLIESINYSLLLAEAFVTLLNINATLSFALWAPAGIVYGAIHAYFFKQCYRRVDRAGKPIFHAKDHHEGYHTNWQKFLTGLFSVVNTAGFLLLLFDFLLLTFFPLQQTLFVVNESSGEFQLVESGAEWLLPARLSLIGVGSGLGLSQALVSILKPHCNKTLYAVDRGMVFCKDLAWAFLGAYTVIVGAVVINADRLVNRIQNGLAFTGAKSIGISVVVAALLLALPIAAVFANRFALSRYYVPSAEEVANSQSHFSEVNREQLRGLTSFLGLFRKAAKWLNSPAQHGIELTQSLMAH